MLTVIFSCLSEARVTCRIKFEKEDGPLWADDVDVKIRIFKSLIQVGGGSSVDRC